MTVVTESEPVRATLMHADIEGCVNAELREKNLFPGISLETSLETAKPFPAKH